jgi:hypothetical protein
MSDKITMSWMDFRGNKITEEVNPIADARNVVGLAGYPWIIIGREWVIKQQRDLM